MSTLSSYATDPGYRTIRFRTGPGLVLAAVFLAGALMASLLTWVVAGNDQSTSAQLRSTSEGARGGGPGGVSPGSDLEGDEIGTDEEDENEENDTDPDRPSTPDGTEDSTVVEWSAIQPPPEPLIGGDALMVSTLTNEPGSTTSSEQTIEIWADDGRAFIVRGGQLIDGMPTEVAQEIANPLADVIDALDRTTTASPDAAVDALLVASGLDPVGLTLAQRNEELWRILSRLFSSGTLEGVRWTRAIQLADSLNATEFVLVDGNEEPDRPGEVQRSRSGPFVDIRWSGHSDSEDRSIRLSAASGVPVLGGIGPIDEPDAWMIRTEFDVRRIRLADLTSSPDSLVPPAETAPTVPPTTPDTPPTSVPPRDALPANITDLSLDYEGLMIRTPEGRSLLLPFGTTDRDTIAFTMNDLYGVAPTQERFGVDCDGLQTDEVLWGDLTMSFDRLEGRFIGWRVSGPNPGIGATNGAQYGTILANFPQDLDGLLFRVGSRWVYDDLAATWVFDDSGPNGRLVEFWTGQVCF